MNLIGLFQKEHSDNKFNLSAQETKEKIILLERLLKIPEKKPDRIVHGTINGRTPSMLQASNIQKFIITLDMLKRAGKLPKEILNEYNHFTNIIDSKRKGYQTEIKLEEVALLRYFAKQTIKDFYNS